MKRKTVHGTNSDNESASVRETNVNVAREMNRERVIWKQNQSKRECPETRA